MAYSVNSKISNSLLKRKRPLVQMTFKSESLAPIFPNHQPHISRASGHPWTIGPETRLLPPATPKLVPSLDLNLNQLLT